jgi:trimethylamine--corrinoid protein Co-methyltransferase
VNVEDGNARRVSRRRPRAGAAERAPGGQPANPAYRRLANPLEPIRLFSEDQVEALHGTALDILEDTGVKVLHPEARHRLSRAGAVVDPQSLMVRIDRGLVAELLAGAPREIRLCGGGMERDVAVGGRNVAIAAVGGPPNIMDLEAGRRPGTLADYRNLTRLSQAFDVIHLLGPSVEPMDVPVHLRHLEVTHTQLTLSDKVPFVFSRGAPQVADCLAMFRIARRLSAEQFAAAAFCFTVINTNSPLQIDIPMAQGSSTSPKPGSSASSRRSRWPARWRRSPSPAPLSSSTSRRWPALRWRRSCGRGRRWFMADSPPTST